jgi:hypothetical protein
MPPERKNFAVGKREGISDLEPDDWELPPKPKWMRWRTYNGLAERFQAYDDMTYPDDSTFCVLAARLMRRSR